MTKTEQQMEEEEEEEEEEEKEEEGQIESHSLEDRKTSVLESNTNECEEARDEADQSAAAPVTASEAKEEEEAEGSDTSHVYVEQLRNLHIFNVDVVVRGQNDHQNEGKA